VTAANIVIATGTRPTRDEKVPLDGKRIFLSDDILDLDHLPRSLTVVGAGAVGCGYAALCVAVSLSQRCDRDLIAPQLVSFPSPCRMLFLPCDRSC